MAKELDIGAVAPERSRAFRAAAYEKGPIASTAATGFALPIRRRRADQLRLIALARLAGFTLDEMSPLV